jgi:hypothetical protein
MLKIPGIYIETGSSLQRDRVPTILKPHATGAWRKKKGKGGLYFCHLVL